MSCTQCNDTGTFVPRTLTLLNGAWKTEHHLDRAKTCPLCEGTGDQKYRWPFSCGTEAADWKEANCYRCLKGCNEEE